jgi:hypothetical protein
MHIRHLASWRKLSVGLLAGIALVALSGCYPYYYDAHYSHGGGHYKQGYYGKQYGYQGGHSYGHHRYKRDRRKRYRYYRY